MLTIRRTATSLAMLFVFVIAQGHAAAAGTRHPSQRSASPEEVVQEFYDWYLHAHFPSPKKRNLAKFSKYITQSFLKQAMAPDVDVVLFIYAQDADATWADNFSVSKATIRGSQATVQLALNGKEMKHKLRVTLRRGNGVWKIDNVEDIDQRSLTSRT